MTLRACLVSLVLLFGCASASGGRGNGGSAGGRTIGEPAASAEPGSAIVSEEVTFEAGDRQVHGTLTRPEDASRRPGVLLVAGSGPTDRDWRSPLLEGDNGSGRLLAEALSRAGYVCLRYDKLASGESGAPALVTWDEYESEQRAALARLLAEEAVDGRLFVVGHSEGGVHAIRLLSRLSAAERDRVAGLVLLSTPARSVRDVIHAQLEEQFRAAGLDGVDLVAYLSPVDAAMDAIVEGLEPDLGPVEPAPVRQLVEALANPVSLPFARELLAFDPAEAVARIDVPVLVVGAGRDLQIPLEAARRLAESAREGGNPSVTLHLEELADHVLKEEPTPREELTPAAAAVRYNAPGRRLAPGFLDALLAWLGGRSGL